MPVYIVNREQILGSRDLRRQFVETPAWKPADVPEVDENGDPVKFGVYVRELTDAERSKFEYDIVSVRENRPGIDKSIILTMKSKLAAICMVDEQYAPLFGETDVKLLGRKSSSTLAKIIDVIFELSGFNDNDKADIEGNSVKNGDSSTD